uniref:Uncharacterized protein n=1 Tax=Rhizophora mucronata TaxID=61149 RepID=A0A2P2KWA3_RHIMU
MLHGYLIHPGVF